jgi:hypothetical protein
VVNLDTSKVRGEAGPNLETLQLLCAFLLASTLYKRPDSRHGFSRSFPR